MGVFWRLVEQIVGGGRSRMRLWGLDAACCSLRGLFSSTVLVHVTESTARMEIDVANLGAGLKIVTSFVLRIDAAFYGLAFFFVLLLLISKTVATYLVGNAMSFNGAVCVLVFSV